MCWLFNTKKNQRKQYGRKEADACIKHYVRFATQTKYRRSQSQTSQNGSYTKKQELKSLPNTKLFISTRGDKCMMGIILLGLAVVMVLALSLLTYDDYKTHTRKWGENYE